MIMEKKSRAETGREILRVHVLGALNNGASAEEIRDVIMQVAIYAGIPAGVEGTRVAEAVLTEKGLIENGG